MISVAGVVVVGSGGGGFESPMTTEGDLIIGGVGGVPARLAAGTNGYILRVAAGRPAWRENSAYGLIGARPGAAAVREDMVYWASDAAAGAELSKCLHKGSGVYAWETIPYGTRAQVVVGGFVAITTGSPAGSTIIADGAGDLSVTSADVSAFLAAASAAAARTALGAALAYTRAPIAPSCVSRWLFSDAGATIDDSVGALDLAYSGLAAYQGRPSLWGGCLYSGSLVAGEGPKGATSLEPAALSVLLWVRPYSYTGTPFIFMKRQDDTAWGADPTTAAVACYIGTDGLLTAFVQGGDPGEPVAASSGVSRRLPLDVWSLITITYSVADGWLRLYVDGQLVASAAELGEIDYAAHGSWCFGATTPPAAPAFDGFIRDAQVCSAVLTAAQVLEHYQRCVGTYGGQ